METVNQPVAIDLKTATLENLKALAYDCLVSRERINQTLSAINIEIETRLKAEQVKAA